MTRRGVLLGAAAGALVLPTAACGIEPSAIVSLGPAPSAVAATALPVEPALDPTEFLLYFYQGGSLTAVYRTESQSVTEDDVLKALISGPSTTERSDGYSSALPEGLVATPNAQQFKGAYELSAILSQPAKAEFICTMQNFEQLSSIGIEAPGLASNPAVSEKLSLIWNACSDTTGYYVQMTFPTTTPPNE